MNSQRHILRRYESGRSQDFDEQFWPVALALCVLAALTVGTILTLLRGPWMWASLLAIPILVGLGLLGLSYVEQRFWRRSIQIALLLSFAFHLFALIIACRTEIFGGRPAIQVAQPSRPAQIPQLEISVTQAEEIWNQPNEIETPDTEVTNEREQNSTVAQPTVARAASNDAAQVNPNPKLDRRESASETTPQVGQSLSMKSRRFDTPSRQSREITFAAASAPPSKSSATAAEPTEVTASDQVELERKTAAAEPESVLRRQPDPASTEQAHTRNANRREERAADPVVVAAARQPRRTAQVQPQPSTSPAQLSRTSTADTNIENSRSDVPAADVAATRRDPSTSLTRSTEDKSEPRPRDRQLERGETTQIADAMAAPTASTRNQRQSQSRAPAEIAIVEDRTQAMQHNDDQTQPSAQSAQIARQQTLDRTTSSHGIPTAQLEQTPTDQPAREIVRRAQPVQRPSEVSTAGEQPRLARDAAPAPTTTQPIEAPAVAAASGQPSTTTLEAKPFALSRATNGIAGSGATPNFGRAADSAVSPAQIASDSARREQTTSSSNIAAALSPSQASKTGRSTAGLEAAHATLPATSVTADRAAGNEPQPIDASSAAALTSASAAGRRSEISAAMGSADLDIGSTKIVSGTARRESAGGGQPEIRTQPPASSRAGERSGAAQATIVAEIDESTSAILADGSGRPAATIAEPNALAAVEQRRGANKSRATGPSRGEFTGEPTDISSAANTSNQAGARRTQRSERGADGEQSVDDEQSSEVRRASIVRQTAADAPATEGQPGGLARQSTAERTASEPESASGDVSRSNYSDSVSAVSPAKSQSDDGFAGTSRIASNSMQRRSEDSPQTDGDPQSMASSPDRSAQSLQLEIASGTDGAEFDRGMKADVDASDSEPTARSLDAQRATGKGQSSIGPLARKDDALAATAAPLVDGNGRARATAATTSDEANEIVSASKPNRATGGSTIDDSATTLVTSNNPGSGVAANSISDSDQVTAAKRTERSEARIDIDWDEGAGGLGRQMQSDLGVASRRASPTSTVVALEPTSRFRRRDTSGELSASPAAVIANEAFMGRNPGGLSKSGPQTEQAIESGLAFLIRNQHADGHWSLLGFDDGHSLQQFQMDSDTAATGLAILAFQGAGYNHREFKYADRVNRAVAWLVSHQRADGNLYVGSDKVSDGNCQLYSHGIATLALTEAFGMTQDSAIRDAAQKSVDFIVNTQDPIRGGWRYFSETGLRSTDTSVTGWMVMALHSARLAGLNVDSKVWSGVDDWLDTARVPDAEFQFVYDPHIKDDSDGKMVRSHLRRAANSTTAIGLLMRMYTGWARNDPRLLEGASDLLKQLPTEFNSELRDTYYWYYATQVLRHIDGPQWQKWNQALHPLLLSTQVPDGDLAGSWNPFTPVEDKWGKYGGRLYLTTLNLLSLEVDYRLLPLYEKTVAPRD